MMMIIICKDVDLRMVMMVLTKMTTNLITVLIKMRMIVYRL